MDSNIKTNTEESGDRNLLSLAAELGLENISKRINSGLEGRPIPTSWNRKESLPQKPFSQLT